MTVKQLQSILSNYDQELEVKMMLPNHMIVNIQGAEEYQDILMRKTEIVLEGETQ